MRCFSRYASLVGLTLMLVTVDCADEDATGERNTTSDAVSDSESSSERDSEFDSSTDTQTDLPADGNLLTSANDGPWWDPSTWEPPKIPHNGDRVVVYHDLTVGSDTIVGASTRAGSDAAIEVKNTGTLTVAENVELVTRGDLLASGTVTLDAGASLVMDSSNAAAPKSTVYIIEITPGDTSAHLQINGTASNRCYVGANPHGSHTRITDGELANGGRVVASFCDFENLGGFPDYRAYQYNFESSNLPYRFEDCTFERSSQVKYNRKFAMAEGGNIAFKRCKWSHSVEKPVEERDEFEHWFVFETWSQKGVSSSLIKCDFDKHVGLFLPEDMVIEDNVFRAGVVSYPHEGWGGQWRSFKRNFLHAVNSGLSLSYGNTVEDNVFMYDASVFDENPHFGNIQHRTGAVSVKGNIFWWNGTSPTAEGDGFIIDGADTGTRADNTVTFENNIFLPNGAGPDSVNNLSCTGFTVFNTSSNKQVFFKNNTLYTGNRTGGINLGETHATTAHDVAGITNNIFVGGLDGNGMKVNDLNHSVVDTFLAQNVDYNAGYRIADGSLFGDGSESAKGYAPFVFSDSYKTVGAHDLDDVAPLFVDPHRTPVTWGQSAEGTMDRLSPGGGYSMNDLLNYIREGFRPTNEALRNAGHPADGHPDIGAVELE